MSNGDMHLGKLCKYAADCPVYKGQINGLKTPSYLIRNVFCNRGIKGWKNCTRFRLLEENKEVTNSTTPYTKYNEYI